MKKDLVIGIVGTLILLTAMVGVFRYEASQRGASFDVSWETRSLEAAALEGGTNEGETTAETVTLDHLNLTTVEFVLSWTDETANTAPDEFNVTVTSPEGVTRSATASNGALVVTFENISRPPPPVRLLGGDQDAVAAQAARDYATRVGTGVWHVNVTLVNAGDYAADGTVPVPQLQDNANAWTLTPRLTVFEARVEPA